jgi:hypothetical protein
VAEEGGFVFDTISILADPDGPRASERRSVICNAGTTIGPFFNWRSQESRSICWVHAHHEKETNPSLSTLSETLRAELFTESEGECGENRVEQEVYCRAGFVGRG